MEQHSVAGAQPGQDTTGTEPARPASAPRSSSAVEPILVLRTTDPADTQAVAAKLSTVLADGDLLVLTGDLGAGKTCFTQGLGRGLGIDDRITSPTFTLANRYHGRLLLHHLDVYRLDSLAETMDLGLGELLEDGVTVIEWGDRIGEVLPVDHLVVALRYPDPSPDSDAELGWDDPALTERIIELRPAGAGPSRWRDRGLDRLLSGWRHPR